MKIKGEIRPRFLRVNYWEPTNFGNILTVAKYFRAIVDAKRFAKRIAKRMQKKYQESIWVVQPLIEIVDECDNVIMAWRMENGKVVGYQKSN